MAAIKKVPPLDAASGAINVIVETPQGSRIKYKYSPQSGYMELSNVLPSGMVFPFDFGFIPGTLGGDGDPLDVLLLGDAPAAVGTLARARLVGAIEAEQTKQGKTERNDRLLAVPVASRVREAVHSLHDLPETLLTELERFFVNYLALKGSECRILGRVGPDQARRLVEQGLTDRRQ
jgi:inorganic pyrophosphatase